MEPKHDTKYTHGRLGFTASGHDNNDLCKVDGKAMIRNLPNSLPVTKRERNTNN